MPRWYDSRFMSFLVTGGTGFIGSYVIHNLLQHGHRVVCVRTSSVGIELGRASSQPRFPRPPDNPGLPDFPDPV